MPKRANPNLPKGLRQIAGVYWIDLRLADGKRFRESIGKSRKIAEQRLSQIRTGIAEEKFFPDKAQKQRRARLTLGEAWHGIFLPSQQHIRTLAQTVRTGELFLEYFEDKTPVVDIRPSDIEGWRQKELARGLKVASVNRPLGVLRRFFNHLVSMEKLERSPMVGFKLQDPKNERDRFMSFEEYNRLQAVMHPENLDLVRCAIFTGMRAGEMFPLKWEQVNLGARLITLPMTKNGRPRRVPISDEALIVLQRLPSRMKSPLLFPDPKSMTGYVNQHNFFMRVFKRDCLQAGIVGLTWHDLRRTFACWLLDENVNTRTIQVLLGHADLRMVTRYAHAHERGLLEAVNKIGRNQAMDTCMDKQAGTGTYGPAQDVSNVR